MSCSVCLFLVSFCDRVIQYPRSKQEFSTYTSTYRRTAWNYVVKHSFMVCLYSKNIHPEDCMRASGVVPCGKEYFYVIIPAVSGVVAF